MRQAGPSLENRRSVVGREGTARFRRLMPPSFAAQNLLHGAAIFIHAYVPEGHGGSLKNGGTGMKAAGKACWPCKNCGAGGGNECIGPLMRGSVRMQQIRSRGEENTRVLVARGTGRKRKTGGAGLSGRLTAARRLGHGWRSAGSAMRARRHALPLAAASRAACLGLGGRGRGQSGGRAEMLPEPWPGSPGRPA